MRTGDRASGGRYEIVVGQRLGGRSARAFPGWEQEEVEGGGMLLRGSVADQAALHGVLARLRDLGIPLTSVRRLHDPE